MQYDEIQKHIDYILSIAMKKCNNSYDAEDLASETVLSAIAYLKNGGVIGNIKSFLLTILNRKYYSFLRKKYKLPTTVIAEGFDIQDDEDFVQKLIKEEEEESIRKEVAYLTRSYREIIVKHYFYNEKIGDIAKELKISEGTVKSRLDIMETERKGLMSF